MIDGKPFPTITEAADILGVSRKTVYDWIDRGIIRPPPTIQQGTKDVQYFPETYMKQAKQDLAKFRKAKKLRDSRHL